MKGNKIFRILALATIITLLMAVIPSTPAMAAYGNDIELSSSSGKIGEEITITGTDWNPSTDDPSVERRVSVYFAEDEADEGNYIDTHVKTYDKISGDPLVGYLDDSDEGEFSTTFQVPSTLSDGSDDEDVTFGTYYIYVTLANSTIIYAVAEFTVIGGEIAIDPNKGTVGTQVEISGKDFGNREDIFVEYDDVDVKIDDGDKETDRYGEFADTLITIPESIAGVHTIKVVGADSGAEVTADFTVEPEISISPSSGSPGTEVTVTGTGFGYRTDVFIYFNNDEVAKESTDRYGSFSAAFSVPALGGGTYDVEAEDKDNNAGQAEFSIAASISASPTSGEVGTEVTVSGTGFTGEVDIKYDGASVATATADSSGAFSAKFPVPVSTRGSHDIVASDASSEKSATFTVVPGFSISPTSGSVGTELTVTGTGFSGAVTIKYDETGVATAAAGADGAFKAVFAAPASKGGDHTITISDDANAMQATFAMETTAPAAPAPILPETGGKVKAKEGISLDWGDVIDNSGVVYTLQVAADAAFANIVLQKEALTVSTYSFAEAEMLEPTENETPYYWRVKSVDGASNESAWSAPMSFYVSGGISTSLPDWARYTLIGLGVAFVGLLGFWIGRKTAYSYF